MSTVRAAKAALRTHQLAVRGQRGAAARVTAGHALRRTALAVPELADAGTVAAYVGVGPEPATLPVLDALRDRGVRVLLPVLAPGRALDWVRYDGRLAAAPHGLLEPVGERLGAAALTDVDLVLVPALAVDNEGNRLGRGAGYYDRALVTVAPGVPVLAVVYGDEVLDHVPVEPHDRPVTGALTPGRLLRVPART